MHQCRTVWGTKPATLSMVLHLPRMPLPDSTTFFGNSASKFQTELKHQEPPDPAPGLHAVINEIAQDLAFDRTTLSNRCLTEWRLGEPSAKGISGEATKLDGLRDRPRGLRLRAAHWPWGVPGPPTSYGSLFPAQWVPLSPWPPTTTFPLTLRG